MCDFDQLIWLITGTTLALVAVVASSAIGMALYPSPWYIAAALAGIAAASTALGLAYILHSKLQEYHECRNREQGTSRCSFAWPDGIAKGVLALAAVVFSATLAALVTGTAGFATALFSALALIALLTALLAALLLYRRCRDEEGRGGGGDLGTPGAVNPPGIVDPPGVGGRLL